LVVLGLRWAVPDDLAFHPRWLLPALTTALFVVLTIANPTRTTRKSWPLRTAAMLLAPILSLSLAWSVVLLVWKISHGAVRRGPASTQRRHHLGDETSSCSP
jgi:hypothetical protein